MIRRAYFDVPSNAQLKYSRGFTDTRFISCVSLASCPLTDDVLFYRLKKGWCLEQLVECVAQTSLDIPPNLFPRQSFYLPKTSYGDEPITRERCWQGSVNWRSDFSVVHSNFPLIIFTNSYL